MTTQHLADVAELADAQVSEACDGDIVEVQVLSSAPIQPFTGLKHPVDGFFFAKNNCHGFSEAGVLVNRGQFRKGSIHERRSSSFDGNRQRKERRWCSTLGQDSEFETC